MKSKPQKQQVELAEPEYLSPRINRNALPVLAECCEVMGSRGMEYGDTWENNRWLAVIAVARQFDIHLSISAARAIGAAAMVDVKYSRLEGGYKDDSLVDGINYAANLVGEMRSASNE